MNSVMELPQQFQRVRRRLDQLGYRQPLPLEALPLVERLFADLLQTTDSLRSALQSPQLEQQGGTAAAAGGVAQAQLYKQDNAKLMKACRGRGGRNCGTAK